MSSNLHARDRAIGQPRAAAGVGRPATEPAAAPFQARRPLDGAGSRLKAHRLAAGVALVSVAFIAIAVVVSLPKGSSSKYGGLPSWLPNAKVPVGRVEDASAAHPWLAVQGDTVHVELARGTVTVTTVALGCPRSARCPCPLRACARSQ